MRAAYGQRGYQDGSAPYTSGALLSVALTHVRKCAKLGLDMPLVHFERKEERCWLVRYFQWRARNWRWVMWGVFFLVAGLLAPASFNDWFRIALWAMSMYWTFLKED